MRGFRWERVDDRRTRPRLMLQGGPKTHVWGCRTASNMQERCTQIGGHGRGAYVVGGRGCATCVDPQARGWRVLLPCGHPRTPHVALGSPAMPATLMTGAVRCMTSDKKSCADTPRLALMDKRHAEQTQPSLRRCTGATGRGGLTWKARSQACSQTIRSREPVPGLRQRLGRAASHWYMPRGRPVRVHSVVNDAVLEHKRAHAVLPSEGKFLGRSSLWVKPCRARHLRLIRAATETGSRGPPAFRNGPVSIRCGQLPMAGTGQADICNLLPRIGR
jgi:hypothetical protein